MKGCELCSAAARMYCESDQASLCFDCDAKVHGANFLVARHTRVLLCRCCQSPTPWKAAGARLGPAVSFCDRCVGRSGAKKEDSEDDEREEEGESGGRDNLEEEEEEEEDEDEDEDEEEGEEEEEEDGDFQVVPWSLETETPPPPVASSSSSEESTSRIIRNGSLKRMRENVDLASQDHHNNPCASSRPIQPSKPTSSRTATDDEATSDPSRPSKGRKRAEILPFDLNSSVSGCPPI